MFLESEFLYQFKNMSSDETGVSGHDHLMFPNYENYICIRIT